MADIPYLKLSVTLETDREDLNTGVPKHSRMSLIETAAQVGLFVQVAISPCLPYSSAFLPWLLNCGASRYVVDTFVDGDGSQGDRTTRSPYAQGRGSAWRETAHARELYEALKAAGKDVGWSDEGFCGIPPRERPWESRQLAGFIDQQ